MSDEGWQPDGWGRRARIGVIVPHADLVPETELSAMAPPGVAIHATRVYFGPMARDPRGTEPIELAGLRAYLRPPLLDDAAALLADAPVSVIAYAFTSTSYLGGDSDDDVLKVRLQRRTGGIPVVTTGAAALEALRSLDVDKIALVHPPWISGELNDMGASFFRRHGIDVVSASPIDRPPGGHERIDAQAVYEWVRANVPDGAEAVFFGGNGFRVVGAIDRLERDLGRPVLSANQVLLRAALRAAGVNDAPVLGYGRLLAS
jgi:maleate isomerase